MVHLSRELAALLFPALAAKKRALINLDDESTFWLGRHPEIDTRNSNPFLDPQICQSMIAEIHQERGVDWSYGGYLENRRRIWAGSYLEATGNFIHLGVDFNVPQGTEISVCCETLVMLVDDDHDRDGGWGQRVFLRPLVRQAEDGLLIFAHLQHVRVQPGMNLMRGTKLAEVGGPPDNGNWHSHLHIQAIRSEDYHETLLESYLELDGYGHPDDLPDLQKTFPDPISFLKSAF